MIAHDKILVGFEIFFTNDAVQFINALVGKRHHTVLEQVVQALTMLK
jgi:hypothetical protein